MTRPYLVTIATEEGHLMTRGIEAEDREKAEHEAARTARDLEAIYKVRAARVALYGAGKLVAEWSRKAGTLALAALMFAQGIRAW